MPYFTYGIILLNVLASLAGFRDKQVMERYSFFPAAILGRGEWDRFLVSTFLHVSWAHLIFNMISFYSFALGLEREAGPLYLLVLFFGSALGGDLLALVMHRKDPAYRAVGASGGVSGVIFSQIFLFPGSKVMIFPIYYPLPSWVFAILFVLISLFGMGRGAGRIGHDAHLGGALTGILITGLFYPMALLANPLLLAVVTVPVLASLFFLNKAR